MNKAKLTADAVVAFFHIRGSTPQDGVIENFMLDEDITLVNPTPDEFKKLPQFVVELSEYGFTMAVCGSQCWIVEPLVNTNKPVVECAQPTEMLTQPQ